MRWRLIGDTLLPGAGLVLDGRIGPGLVLIALAGPLALATVLTPLIAVPGSEYAHLGWCLGLYAALAAAAHALRHLAERRALIDPAAIAACHARLARAYLRNEPAEAVAASKELLRLAPDHPGAWSLASLVRAQAHDVAGAQRARRRAASLAAR